MKEISYKCEGCGRKKSFLVEDEDKQKLKNKKSCVRCRRLKRINRKRNRGGQKKLKMNSDVVKEQSEVEEND